MKNKKNKKNKRLITLLLPLLLFSGVSAAASTYAWWNTLQKVEDETVLVGVGLDTVVVANVSDQAGKQLVPAGRTVDAAVEVEQVIFTYDVKLSKAVSVALPFEVVAGNVLIGGDSTYASLVNIAITGAPATLKDTTAQTITVTVTLTEPGDEVVYSAVAGKNITFTLTFTVSQL